MIDSQTAEKVPLMGHDVSPNFEPHWMEMERFRKKSLGVANAWRSKPKAYVQHLKTCLYSDLEVRELGRCYREYTCRKCGIQFTEDSSD